MFTIYELGGYLAVFLMSLYTFSKMDSDCDCATAILICVNVVGFGMISSIMLIQFIFSSLGIN